MSMRYEDRPQSEVKVLGDNISTYRDEYIPFGKIVRRDEYETGKFQIVEFYDMYGNLLIKSELQLVDDKALYRIETHYNTKGIVIRTVKFRRTYDSSGNLISEEVENV